MLLEGVDKDLKMGSEQIWIGSLEKNRRECLRVSLSSFKGYQFVNARVWYREVSLIRSRGRFSYAT